jgi:hypothetical protein
MKQYLLSVHHDGRMPDMPADGQIPPEMQAVFEAVDAFNNEVMAADAWVFAGGLLPPSSATVIDATGDAVVTTDGPYAETKEVLGGFWVIKAPDLDAALAWAAKGSKACQNPVEVRPFQDDAED